MKNLGKTIIVLVTLFSSSVLWAASNDKGLVEKNYFQFAITNYHTSRQAGQTINVYVRYAYKKDLPISEYLDYRPVREKVLSYLQPSKDLPAETFWEILATKMGRELIKDYPFEGVSIQIIALDNQNPKSYEPSDHGPIYTIGNIAPLNVMN